MMLINYGRLFMYNINFKIMQKQIYNELYKYIKNQHN